MSDIRNVFDIMGRALSAQQIRMTTVASNIANADAKASTPEEAFRPLRPVFSSVYSRTRNAEGFASVDVDRVVALNRQVPRVYEPDHPQADNEGYVYRSSVDVSEELVEMLESNRHYQNGLEVVSTVRTLMLRTIDMGK